MQTLFLLIFKYRAFLTFIFLEFLCGWLITNNNKYHSAWLFNSSNAISGGINEASSNVQTYFGLREINQQLATENALLRKELARLNGYSTFHSLPDTVDYDSIQYLFRETKVVNNSTRRFLNYITIDKGSNDGIKPNMGLVGPNGIVGKVKDVSANYSTAYSLLHINLLTSAYVSSTGTFCTVQWDGIDPLRSKVLYVPRHISVSAGDSVLTSGYNAIYPAGLLIGVISDVEVSEDATFFDIDMKLASEFQNLTHVYYIEDYQKEEKDSLELISIEER